MTVAKTIEDSNTIGVDITVIGRDCFSHSFLHAWEGVDALRLHNGSHYFLDGRSTSFTNSILPGCTYPNVVQVGHSMDHMDKPGPTIEDECSSLHEGKHPDVHEVGNSTHCSNSYFAPLGDLFEQQLELSAQYP